MCPINLDKYGHLFPKFCLFIYLFIKTKKEQKKQPSLQKKTKQKKPCHRFCGVDGKEDVAVTELLLVRANHELNITPSSTRNRAKNLQEGELDLQKAYSAKSSSLPRPHQVFFSGINKIPCFSESSLVPAGQRLTLRCDKCGA